MGLELGIGSITWAGDWRLSVLGAIAIAATGATYAVEVYSTEEKKEMDPEDVVPLLTEKTETSPHKPVVSNMFAFYSGLAVLCCSVSLVYTNAWVLSQFPHVATYISVQQGGCFVMALIMVRGFRVVEPVHVKWKTYFSRVAPLGVCFTLYLWGSNTAYKFLQPGLIQMIKPIGSCFVFAHACAFGVERYSSAKALNFALICCGTLLTAAPQILRGVGGVVGVTSLEILYGVSVLIAAYFCDAYYVVSIQRLHEGKVLDRGFDPLSTLMYVSPIACGCLAVVAAFTEPDAGKDLGEASPWYFAVATILAFGFNLSVMNFIGRLSATSYVVFDYFKDLIILSAAFFLFSENFARNELIGYLVVVVGGCTWQHRKLRHLKHAQHNLNARARDLQVAQSFSSSPKSTSGGAAKVVAADDLNLPPGARRCDATMSPRHLSPTSARPSSTADAHFAGAGVALAPPPP